MARLLSDDFELVDHRALGWPTVDVAGTLEVIRTAGDAPTVLMGTEHLLVTEVGAAISVVQWTVEADGSILESVPAISVLAVSSSKIVRLELFAEDEPEAAIAHLMELTAASHGRPE